MDFTIGRALKAVCLGYLALSGRVLSSPTDKYSPSGSNGGDDHAQLAMDEVIKDLAAENFENFQNPYLEAQRFDSEYKSSWYALVQGVVSWIKYPAWTNFSSTEWRAFRCSEEPDSSPRSFNLVTPYNLTESGNVCRSAALEISDMHAEAAIKGVLKSKKYARNPFYACSSTRPKSQKDCKKMGSLASINRSSKKARDLLLTGFIRANCISYNRRNGESLIIHFFLPIPAFDFSSSLDLTGQVSLDLPCDLVANMETNSSYSQI